MSYFTILKKDSYNNYVLDQFVTFILISAEDGPLAYYFNLELVYTLANYFVVKVEKDFKGRNSEWSQDFKQVC